jgi:hypothetical protein
MAKHIGSTLQKNSVIVQKVDAEQIAGLRVYRRTSTAYGLSEEYTFTGTLELQDKCLIKVAQHKQDANESSSGVSPL